ncbi:MAG: 50S ribosomal protein L10 [Planctomyces sp.]|nr:50S ribosomal protein L10 [Planctomyces sp.]MBA4039181.1 50S ribosomal protein L10 [Planctomyces sp.]
MSKPVKSMLMRDYQARLSGANDAMLVSIRGMKAIDTTKLRTTLRKSNIRVLIVRNALARKSFKGTPLEALAPLLTGPSALAFGGNSVVEVARQIVDMLKEFPLIELKGAVLDGNLFEGDKGVKELSKFPTRTEAVAQAVTLILSPARNLAAQIKGPGARVAGLVKAIEERLEKGEAIAKVG